MNEKFTLFSIAQSHAQRTDIMTSDEDQNDQFTVLPTVPNTRYELPNWTTFFSPTKLQRQHASDVFLMALPCNDVQNSDVVIQGQFKTEGVIWDGFSATGEPMLYGTDGGSSSWMSLLDATAETPQGMASGKAVTDRLACAAENSLDNGCGMATLANGDLALAAYTAGDSNSHQKNGIEKIFALNNHSGTTSSPLATDFSSVGVTGVTSTNISWRLSFFRKTSRNRSSNGIFSGFRLLPVRLMLMRKNFIHYLSKSALACAVACGGWLGSAAPVFAQAVTAAGSVSGNLPWKNSLSAEALHANGQLRLNYVLEKALKTHPLMQAARLDADASGEDLLAVQRQRWPVFSAVLENNSTNPYVNSTKLLRLQQTLWDGGRVNARVNEAETQTRASQTRIQIAAMQLQLQVIDAWQSLLAADGRIAVASATIDKLEGYKQQMQRRVEADASPEIDLELVMSRLLQTQVELTQAVNARRVALGKLEQYAGLEGLTHFELKHMTLPALAATQTQALWLSTVDFLGAALQHPNVEKARQDALAAQQRIRVKSAEQYPQLYVRRDQPINSQNHQPVTIIGLSYTPGAGLATRIEAQALSTRAASAEQAVDAAIREIMQVLFADRNEFDSSRSRVQALESAVRGARAVQESYARQFVAGRKQWLDLLNAARELTQNQYALVDSHAAMLGALYRIQIRLNVEVDQMANPG